VWQVKCLPKTLGFYFGTAVFFIGVLMTAIGIENLVVQRMDFIIFAALICGIALIIIGYVVGKRKGAQDTRS
jgi:cytochrome c biogenesis protein CcdA